MTKKDWTGNANSIFKTLGSSHHTEEAREVYDYYATHPKAVEILCAVEKFNTKIWEPACGEGHISKVLEKHGYDVLSSDLIDRGYGKGNVDFMSIENEKWCGDIITNPPYIYAHEFVIKALTILETGNRVAMFLKLQFLASQTRKHLFINYPPTILYVSCARLLCAKNGEFKKVGGSAVDYGWFIWEKGFKGSTTIKWIN